MEAYNKINLTNMFKPKLKIILVNIVHLILLVESNKHNMTLVHHHQHGSLKLLPYNNDLPKRYIYANISNIEETTKYESTSRIPFVPAYIHHMLPNNYSASDSSKDDSHLTRKRRFLNWPFSSNKIKSNFGRNIKVGTFAKTVNYTNTSKICKSQSNSTCNIKKLPKSIALDFSTSFFDWNFLEAQARHIYKRFMPKVEVVTAVTEIPQSEVCTVERQEAAFVEAENKLRCGTSFYCTRRNGKIVFGSFGLVGVPLNWIGCRRTGGKPYIPRSRADNEFLLGLAFDLDTLYSIPDIWYPVYREKDTMELFWFDGTAYSTGPYYDAFDFETDTDRLCFQLKPNDGDVLGDTLTVLYCEDGIGDNVFLCELEVECL